MATTQDNEIDETVGQVEGRLAINRANRLTLLSVPIPSWREKLSTLLLIIYCSFVFGAPKDNLLANMLLAGLFIAILGCHWYVTMKLREKVEALSEIVRESVSRNK